MTAGLLHPSGANLGSRGAACLEGFSLGFRGSFTGSFKGLLLRAALKVFRVFGGLGV